MKLIKFVAVLSLLISLIVITCTLPVDPNNPENSKVVLSLKQNIDSVHADDTITLFAKMAFKQYIDSIHITIDSVTTLRFYRPDTVKSDTIRFLYIFKTQGNRNITAEAFISNKTSSHSSPFLLAVKDVRSSKIATLKSFQLTNVATTPPFNPDSFSYKATVDYKSGIIQLRLIATASQATVKVNDSVIISGDSTNFIPLIVGENIIAIRVTSSDGTVKRNYSLIITRSKDATATLNSLTLSSGTFYPEFDPAVTSYIDTIESDIHSFTITTAPTESGEIVIANGDTLKAGTPSSTIKLVAGVNTIPVIVTAPDGSTKKTYTLSIYRKGADDATLKGLTLSSGVLSPFFAPDTLSYTTTVSSDVASIKLTATSNDSNATIKVNNKTTLSGSPSDSIPLKIGNNTITIIVNAEDKSAQIAYTVIISRPKSSDASLSSLSVLSQTISPEFESIKTNYTVTVNNAVSSIKIFATAMHPKTLIKVNGTPLESTGSTDTIALKVGSNTLTIVCLAEDSTTSFTYIITALREPSSATPLSSLSISAGTLTPIFNPLRSTYSVNVANADSSISIIAIPRDSTANIKINDHPVLSGIQSDPVPLLIGGNTIKLLITAQDTNSQQFYILTVNRPKSSNATISNMTVSAGTLAPIFSPGHKNYTLLESNSTQSITLTTTTAHPLATLMVNGQIVLSGKASSPIQIPVGIYPIYIEATAEDGITKDADTITVIRQASTISTLNGLTVSPGTLNPAFSPIVSAYSDSVSLVTTSMTLTPVSTDAQASIQIDGKPAISGQPFTISNLPFADTTITISVIAQDTTAKTNYTLKISKQKHYEFRISSANTVTYSSSRTLSTSLLDTLVKPIELVSTDTSENIVVGWYLSGLILKYRANGLLRFDNLTSFISKKTVVSAKLRLTSAVVNPISNTISANDSSYDPKSVTWGTKPGVISTTAVQSNSPEKINDIWEIDVLSIVKTWADGTVENNGFSISQSTSTSALVNQEFYGPSLSLVKILRLSKAPTLYIELQ